MWRDETTGRDGLPATLRAAVIIVVGRGDEYLLLRHRDGPFKGEYTALGGKVEPGETHREAAARELEEETGVSGISLRLVGSLVELSETDFNWWSAVFVGATNQRATTSCEEGRLEWVHADALTAQPIPAIERILLEQVALGKPFFLCARYASDLSLQDVTEEYSGVQLLPQAGE